MIIEKLTIENDVIIFSEVLPRVIVCHQLRGIIFIKKQNHDIFGKKRTKIINYGFLGIH